MGAAAKATGTDRIEIYTGPYGHTFDPALKTVERAKVAACAQAAHDAGLKVNAGHDLTVDNLPPLLAEAPMIAEVSIGHAVTADALAFGMAETVRRFLKACSA
jgi:pyridoxine 5-phosphate synthase